MAVTNVKSAWVGGDLYFYDAAGDEIAHWDGTNRAFVIPTGSALTVDGVTVDSSTLAVNGLTASAAELNVLDGITADVTAAILSAISYRRGGRKQATVSADTTLALADAGTVQVVDTDAKVITLPATHVGDVYIVENGGADGAVTVTISPQAADKISGAGLTPADNKDLINTKATARKGDYVKLIAEGVDGFVVAEMVGIWAREA